MDCSDMKIISVILGIYYEEVTNERMRYVKVWKESKSLMLLLTSDKLILACGTLSLLKKPQQVFVSLVLHVLIRVPGHL